jgi:hypothetical protein
VPNGPRQYEDALGDLLCGLMHSTDRNDFDFEAAQTARGLRAETAPELIGDRALWQRGVQKFLHEVTPRL